MRRRGGGDALTRCRTQVAGATRDDDQHDDRGDAVDRRRPTAALRHGRARRADPGVLCETMLTEHEQFVDVVRLLVFEPVLAEVVKDGEVGRHDAKRVASSVGGVAERLAEQTPADPDRTELPQVFTVAHFVDRVTIRAGIINTGSDSYRPRRSRSRIAGER